MCGLLTVSHGLERATVRRIGFGGPYAKCPVMQCTCLVIPQYQGQLTIFSLSSLVFLSAFGLPPPSHSFRPHHIRPAHVGLQHLRRSFSRGASLGRIMAEGSEEGKRKSKKWRAAGLGGRRRLIVSCRLEIRVSQGSICVRGRSREYPQESHCDRSTAVFRFLGFSRRNTGKHYAHRRACRAGARQARSD